MQLVFPGKKRSNRMLSKRPDGNHHDPQVVCVYVIYSSGDGLLATTTSLPFRIKYYEHLGFWWTPPPAKCRGILYLLKVRRFRQLELMNHGPCLLVECGGVWCCVLYCVVSCGEVWCVAMLCCLFANTYGTVL